MGCPHIQQTARALRSRSHAIFRMYGQRDARPTPVVLLFCVCCIADPAPGSSLPRPGLYPPRHVPQAVRPPLSFTEGTPGECLRGQSAPAVLWYLKCYRRALKKALYL